MNSLMYKSEYGKMYHSEDKLWWYIGLRDILQHYIATYAPLNPAILDAGCGTGKNMKFLTSLGYTDVQGFDYSPDAISFCKMRGLPQAVLGNITSIIYTDKSFDIIICMDVLGLLPEADRIIAVNEMFRVLKPGGIILCHAAALEIFRSQHDNVTNVKLRFTRLQFKKLFYREGTHILKLSYRIFLLSPLVFIYKLIKRISGIFTTQNHSRSDQVVFPFVVNWVLLKVQQFENKIFNKFNLFFGSSVFIAIRKID